MVEAGYVDNNSFSNTYPGTLQGNLSKASHNPPYAKKVIVSLVVLCMEKRNLKELIINLEKELLRLGYTKGGMTFYNNRWEILLLFGQEPYLYSQR